MDANFHVHQTDRRWPFRTASHEKEAVHEGCYGLLENVADEELFASRIVLAWAREEGLKDAPCFFVDEENVEATVYSTELG